MLTQPEAESYNASLHPAFAGYLLDGEVTNVDTLATIFKLFNTRALSPIFEDNQLTKRIVAVRRGEIPPQLKFEKDMLGILFENDTEVTSQELGTKIQDPRIKELIMTSLIALTEIKIISQELEVYRGKQKIVFYQRLPGGGYKTINTVSGYKGVIGLLLGMALLMAGIGVYSLKDNIYLSTVTIGAAIFITIAGLLYAFAKRVIKVDFGTEVLPKAKVKYDELFNFLKANPLQPHVFTNTFLPFSIAFGLDQSWNADFNLGHELTFEPANTSNLQD